jgi:hypothetical protein
MRPRKVSIASAIAVALALAGCGGSSSDGGLSKAQLDVAVNAACATYLASVASIPVPSDFAQNPVAAAAYLDKVKPLVSAEYTAIESLVPHAGVKADFQTYQTDGKHQLALFNSALAKAHSRDPSGIQDIQALSVYKQSVLAPLESKLGFTGCLTGSQTSQTSQSPIQTR